VLAQIQDPFDEYPPGFCKSVVEDNLDNDEGLETRLRVMMLGGGAFISDFPPVRETKSSEAVDAKFSAECETGVSSFSQ